MRQATAPRDDLTGKSLVTQTFNLDLSEQAFSHFLSDRFVEISDNFHVLEVRQIEKLLLLSDLNPRFEPRGTASEGINRVDHQPIMRRSDRAIFHHLR